MMTVFLLLVLLLVSSVASINISMTSGDPVLCEGAVATWTCVVDGGSGIGWRNLGEYELPFAVSSVLFPLGSPSPFGARATCITGSVITSIATANLTSAVNGSTLECSDGAFSSPSTTTSNITLLLEDSSPVQLIITKLIGSSLSELIIHICWPKSTCAPSYRVNIMRDNQPLHESITEDTCYEYNVPDDDIGTYTMYVSSIDYFGVMTGQPAETTVHIRPPDIRIIPRFNYTSNNVSFIIQDSIEDQLPITSCNIRLMSDDGSYVNDTDCTQRRLVEFNVMCGRSYNYNLTIGNVAGLTSESGPITFCSMTSETPCTPCPSCPPPPPCKLCLWALILIIALGVLFVSAVAFIIMELCWRRHCCNVDCWDSLFWTYLFCYCLRNCSSKEEKIRAVNRETESPSGKETKM